MHAFRSQFCPSTQTHFDNSAVHCCTPFIFAHGNSGVNRSIRDSYLQNMTIFQFHILSLPITRAARTHTANSTHTFRWHFIIYIYCYCNLNYYTIIETCTHCRQSTFDAPRQMHFVCNENGTSNGKCLSSVIPIIIRLIELQ